MEQEQARFDRIELVEVECDSVTQTKFMIKDRDNLRDTLINAVMVIPLAKVSELPSGRPNINANVFLKSTLTLSVDGEESIDNIPFTVFNTSDNDGRLFVFSKPKKVNWEKSHIDVATVSNLAATESFCLVVFYEKKK